MTHLKFGYISNLDIPNGLAKVYFDDDDFESGWLKVSVLRSSPDQASFPFDPKEHVWCMMDEHLEYGVIGGAIYDEGNKPAGAAAGQLLIKFGDSSVIKYNRISHILTLDIQGKTIINCTEADLNCSVKANIAAPQVNIDAPETNIDGILNVTGAANIAGVVAVGGLASATPGAAIPASTADLNVKSVTASDDVTVGTVSLKTHKHLSAGSGSPTGTPIP